MKRHSYVNCLLSCTCYLTSVQRVAREKHAIDSAEQRRERNERRLIEDQRRAQLHEQQVKEVEAQLAVMNLQKQQEETRLRAQWKERDRKLWERIDTVIKIEDERVRLVSVTRSLTNLSLK